MTEDRTVRVVEYDEAWPRIYADEADELRTVLGGTCRAIHHIGSTSVPGLAAKPVIDMLLEATSLDDLDEASPTLEDRGYRAKGEYGIAGRRYFSRPADRDSPKIHLHAFREGHEHGQRHLRLRDFLRANADRARLYGALKAKLAELHARDRHAYQEAKAPFIEVLLDEAGARPRSGGPT